MLVLLPALNFVLWAAATRLDGDRQFLHDRLAGTRLIWVPPLKKATAEDKKVSSDAARDQTPHQQ